MNNKLVNLTGSVNGVFQGSCMNSMSNCYYKNLTFDSIVFINNEFISYNIDTGVFTTKLSGVYNFSILLNTNLLSNEEIFIKLIVLSSNNYNIVSTENILKDSLDLSLKIYIQTKCDDGFKFRILLSSKCNLTYQGNLYINYSLNSI